MANLGRKLMWAVVGGAVTKTARSITRNALHTPTGSTKLPAPVRRNRNMETALLLALGTGVVLALGDVLSEQTKTAARVRPQHPKLE
ncbi:MAG: hypothetical protein JO306_15765 [Gemmatimonadetes bacterium]|nr:hypothetical protein [Gemmatimonadota bacterium]